MKKWIENWKNWIENWKEYWKEDWMEVEKMIEWKLNGSWMDRSWMDRSRIEVEKKLHRSCIEVA